MISTTPRPHRSLVVGHDQQLGRVEGATRHPHPQEPAVARLHRLGHARAGEPALRRPPPARSFLPRGQRSRGPRAVPYVCPTRSRVGSVRKIVHLPARRAQAAVGGAGRAQRALGGGSRPGRHRPPAGPARRRTVAVAGAPAAAGRRRPARPWSAWASVPAIPGWSPPPAGRCCWPPTGCWSSPPTTTPSGGPRWWCGRWRRPCPSSGCPFAIDPDEAHRAASLQALARRRPRRHRRRRAGRRRRPRRPVAVDRLPGPGRRRAPAAAPPPRRGRARHHRLPGLGVPGGGGPRPGRRRADRGGQPHRPRPPPRRRRRRRS